MSDELDRKLQQLAHEQAETARAPLEWTAVSERANQTPTERHVRRWPAAAAAAVLVIAGVAVIALVRGDGPDTASPATLPAGPDSSDPTAPRSPDASQFCDVYAANLAERPEDYVGSSEHLSDIDTLLDVAPPGIAPDVTTFRDFVASGAIDTDSDPDSNLTANWPSEVRLAIDAIQDFATANCGTSSQTSDEAGSPSTSEIETSDGGTCIASAAAQICATDSSGAIEVTASGLQPGTEFSFVADGVPEASYPVGPDGSIANVGLMVPEGISVVLTVSATDADGQPIQGQIVARR
jgi:hypothetical protein